MATAVRYRVSYHEPEKDKFGLINVEPILGLFMEGDLGNYFGDQVSRLIPFSHTKGKPYFDTFEELCKCENLKIAEGYGSYAQKELDLYYDVGKNRKGRVYLKTMYVTETTDPEVLAKEREETKALLESAEILQGILSYADRLMHDR